MNGSESVQILLTVCLYLSCHWNPIFKRERVGITINGLNQTRYYDTCHHFKSFTVDTMTWLTVTEHLCHKWPLVVNTFQSFPNSWLITKILTRVTRWVSLVEQELLTLPEHLSSTPVFSEVRVALSLVLCVMLVDHCLSSFSFVLSIYRFWLPLFTTSWLVQRLVSTIYTYLCNTEHSQ